MMSSLHSLVNMHHLLSTPFAHLPLRTPNVLQCTMYGWPRPAPTRGSRHYFHSQCHNGYLKEKDLSICCPVDPSSTDGFAKIIGKWNRWDIIRDVAENKPEKFKLRRLGDMGLNPIEVNWYLGAPGSNPKPDFLIFFCNFFPCLYKFAKLILFLVKAKLATYNYEKTGFENRCERWQALVYNKVKIFRNLSGNHHHWRFPVNNQRSRTYLLIATNGVIKW